MIILDPKSDLFGMSYKVLKLVGVLSDLMTLKMTFFDYSVTPDPFLTQLRSLTFGARIIGQVGKLGSIASK